MHYHYVCNTIIGGHGFLEGVGQKICRPLVAAKIFSRWPFHQGVILLNRNEKNCSPQGSICTILISPWGYQGGGVDLFHLGCRPQKVFYPWVHPPHPHPVPIYEHYLETSFSVDKSTILKETFSIRLFSIYKLVMIWMQLKKSIVYITIKFQTSKLKSL